MSNVSLEIADQILELSKRPRSAVPLKTMEELVVRKFANLSAELIESGHEWLAKSRYATRTKATADEIKLHVRNEINSQREMREDKVDIQVPEPQWHEPDELACNWSMPNWTNIRGYSRTIFDIVSETQLLFQLEQ